VLLVGPTMATTEDEEDVDGGPTRGCYLWVRQWPPPQLKGTSMVGPLGVLPVSFAAATTKEEEDIDSGPPGGTVGKSGSGHHRR
jgi:hypothetical protein